MKHVQDALTRAQIAQERYRNAVKHVSDTYKAFQDAVNEKTAASEELNAALESLVKVEYEL